MKKLLSSRPYMLSAAIAAVILASGCGNKEGEEPAKTGEVKLDTLEQKVTYIVGYNMTKQANANGLTFDKDVIAQAVQDVLDEKEPRIPEAEMQETMMAFQEKQEASRQEKMSKAAEENLQEGQAFLAENAQKEGVVTTESGLQYKVLESGEEGAPSPKEEDTVKVHYHGQLIDGTVFDSSVDRGQPVTFPVNGVIKGWVEALQLMKEGDKFELYIPSDLAYGPGGTSGPIGPNETLIFQVELLEVNPEQAEAKPKPASPH